MDVRDLAPAMLALGQLFDAANSPLNGDSARVGVHVKATELGLFQITFEVLQTNGALLVSLLSGPTVTAAANLVGLVIGSPAGTERLSVSSGLPQQRQRLSELEQSDDVPDAPGEPGQPSAVQVFRVTSGVFSSAVGLVAASQTPVDTAKYSARLMTGSRRVSSRACVTGSAPGRSRAT